MKKLILFLTTSTLIFSAVIFVYGKPDNSYVEEFPQDAAINIFAERSFMTVISVENDGGGIQSKGDANDKIGIGLGYKGVGFSYAFDADSKNKTDTKSYDFQFYFFPKQWIVEAFYQYYRGYIKSMMNDGFQRDWKGAQMTRSGLSVQYVFNPNLSIEAAFNQTKRQKKYADSFLLGAAVYYNDFNLNLPNDFYDGSLNGEGNNWLIGPVLGYGYTIVFLKNFYFTGVISTGINITFGNTIESSLFWTFMPKFALGYNADTWALALSFLYNYGIVDAGNYSKTKFNPNNVLETGKLTLSLTKRFNIF